MVHGHDDVVGLALHLAHPGGLQLPLHEVGGEAVPRVAGDPRPVGGELADGVGDAAEGVVRRGFLDLRGGPAARRPARLPAEDVTGGSQDRR